MIEYICLTYFLFLTFLGLSILRKAAFEVQNPEHCNKVATGGTGIIRMIPPLKYLHKKAFDMINI